MLHFATDQDRCNQLARQHVNAAYKMENKRTVGKEISRKKYELQASGTAGVKWTWQLYENKGSVGIVVV